MTRPLTDRIEHIVVLMFENRSFDNVFGGLYPERTRAGSFRGLTGTETIPLDPANPSAGSVQVFQGPSDTATWTMPYPDPGESYRGHGGTVVRCRDEPVAHRNPGHERIRQQLPEAARGAGHVRCGGPAGGRQRHAVPTQPPRCR